MTADRHTWRSGAHSRWHGERTRLVPHWTPRPQPRPRPTTITLSDLRLDPPTANGPGAREGPDGEPDASSPL
jgi:hypothetical protein